MGSPREEIISMWQTAFVLAVLGNSLYCWGSGYFNPWKTVKTGAFAAAQLSIIVTWL